MDSLLFSYPFKKAEWQINCSQPVIIADNKSFKVKTNGFFITATLDSDGIKSSKQIGASEDLVQFKPMGAIDYKDYNLLFIYIKEGSLFCPRGAVILESGIYIITGSVLAYGAPLDWKGEIRLLETNDTTDANELII